MKNHCYCANRVNRVFVVYLVMLSVRFCAPLAARASEGAYLTGLDAIHMQRAGGGVASPRSAAWMLVNPASLTALEPRLDLSLATYIAGTEVDARGISANWFASPLNSQGITLVPSGGIVLGVPGGKLGLGLYVPAGSATDFSDSRNIPTYLAFGNRDRRLTYQHIRGIAAYAHEFDNGWSLGLGLHASLTRLRTDHLTLRLSPAVANNEWDEAPGFGFGLGIYRDWDRAAIGLGYISRHWVGDLEKYHDLLPKHVDLPQSLQAGIAVRVTPALELTCDYRWIDWTDIDIFGASVYENSLDWDDQDLIKLGIEWRVSDRCTLRAGWSHGHSPIERDHAFLSMLAPATAEDQITGGISFKTGPKSEIHLTYLHAFPHSVRDTGRGEFFSYQARGSEFHTDIDTIAVGYTLMF